MAENKTLEHLPEVRAAVAALSPEDWELLAAVQASPFKLTTPEQFKEFAANIDYFVFEPNIASLLVIGKTSFRSSIIQDAGSCAQRLPKKFIPVHAAAVVPVPLQRSAAHPHFA